MELNEEQNSSAWLIILGVLQLRLYFLSSWWGWILIAIGIFGLVYKTKKMILIFGIIMILAGFLNTLVILDIIFYNTYILQGFWAILGAYQIYWGIKEIKKFIKR